MPESRTDSSDLVALTIVAHNYIPRASIVADSFLAHHPGARFYIVVTDYPLQVKLRQRDDCRLVPITEIDFGDEGFEYMATYYEVTEFATAIKPFVLKHFLKISDCVLYLDPDVEVFDTLDPIVAATKRAGISLTPHTVAPIARDGCQPNEASIMSAGIYNLGYIGVARSALPFLDWWSTRLRRDAITDPSKHLFTDQRWIDLSIPLFSPHIETNPGYNVAYWNLDRRPIRREQDRYWVGDEPLRFFHFSGYDPKRPHWISKHQVSLPRVVLSNQPVLTELFDNYRAKLLALTSEVSPLPYGWSQVIPGLTLTDEVRRTFRNEVLLADAGKGEMPPSPFKAGSTQAFMQWLAEPSPTEQFPFPRYLGTTWLRRPELWRRTPEDADGDLATLRAWVHSFGGAESDMLAFLGWLPPSTGATGVQWHAAGAAEHGVNLVGYLNAELGVGESARLTYAALVASDVPVATVATRRTSNRQGVAFVADNIARYDTVVMGVNADQIGVVQADLGAPFIEGRYVIGQWYWELAEFPAELRGAFKFVDEVWAASTFVRDAIAAVAPRRVAVTHMPIAMTAPLVDPSYTRTSFGLPDGFMFLFSWDMMSVFERKNPDGLVSAYCDAFAPTDGACLVLKTMNGEANVEKVERLRWSCRDRADIFVIDEVFDHVRAGSLTNLSDCFVSLHRSEGLGLSIAEAMLLGKPVIATGYSGNVDFTTDDAARLVRWKPTTVPKTAFPYRPGAMWAEPDLGHATELMRALFDEPQQARQLGIAGQARLREDYSLDRCGARMRSRLKEIWET